MQLSCYLLAYMKGSKTIDELLFVIVLFETDPLLQSLFFLLDFLIISAESFNFPYSIFVWDDIIWSSSRFIFPLGLALLVYLFILQLCLIFLAEYLNCEIDECGDGKGVSNGDYYSWEFIYGDLWLFKLLLELSREEDMLNNENGVNLLKEDGEKWFGVAWRVSVSTSLTLGFFCFSFFFYLVTKEFSKNSLFVRRSIACMRDCKYFIAILGSNTIGIVIITNSKMS